MLTRPWRGGAPGLSPPPHGANYWKVLWGVDNTCLMKVNRNYVLGSHNERHMRSKCNVLFLCFLCGTLVYKFCSLSSKGCCPLPKVLSNNWPHGGGRDKPGAPPRRRRVSTFATSYQHIAISTINHFNVFTSHVITQTREQEIKHLVHTFTVASTLLEQLILF